MATTRPERKPRAGASDPRAAVARWEGAAGYAPWALRDEAAAALLLAADADPAGDTPKLVLADRLDDLGESGHAAGWRWLAAKRRVPSRFPGVARWDWIPTGLVAAGWYPDCKAAALPAPFGRAYPGVFGRKGRPGDLLAQAAAEYAGMTDADRGLCDAWDPPAESAR